jgi:ATP-dependent Clp protease adaptor protein ClpS
MSAPAGASGAAPEPAVPERAEPAGDVLVDIEEVQETDKPWLVIVWNDPINLMSFVTYVLQKLFGYSKEKATKLMLDVHTKGRAVVSSGTRERAELDVYRLHEHGLWATMEQST